MTEQTGHVTVSQVKASDTEGTAGQGLSPFHGKSVVKRNKEVELLNRPEGD